jgi:hypothetical protein
VIIGVLLHAEERSHLHTRRLQACRHPASSMYRICGSHGTMVFTERNRNAQLRRMVRGSLMARAKQRNSAVALISGCACV